MSIADKIQQLGTDVSADVKEILHELAVFVGATAPIAEAVEAVAAPADVVPTEAVAAVADVVEKDTTDAPVSN